MGLQRSAALLPPPEAKGVRREPLASAAQGNDAVRFVVWLVILVELMIFGALLAAYVVLEEARPEVFLFGKFFTDGHVTWLASAFLLTSAFASALAVRFARRKEPRKLLDCIATTFLSGLLATLALGVEVQAKVDQGLLPGAYLNPAEQVWERETFQRFYGQDPELAPLQEVGALGPTAVHPSLPSRPRNAHGFFGLFFLTHGLLLLHLVVGLGVWVALFVRVARRSYKPDRWGGVDGASVFWSMGAVIHCALIPFFYLP